MSLLEYFFHESDSVVYVPLDWESLLYILLFLQNNFSISPLNPGGSFMVQKMTIISPIPVF